MLLFAFRTLRSAAFLALALISALLTGSCGSPECEILPRGVLETLGLRPGEYPADYRSLQDASLLKELQLARNPGYVTKPADVELVARAGGLASFLAFYGKGSNEVALVLNGVYFRDPQRLDAFAALQREKDRPVAAYRRTTTEGAWLLLAARNPDSACGTEELARVRAGLRRYSKRLDLEPIFDLLEPRDAP